MSTPSLIGRHNEFITGNCRPTARRVGGNITIRKQSDKKGVIFILDCIRGVTNIIKNIELQTQRRQMTL